MQNLYNNLKSLTFLSLTVLFTISILVIYHHTWQKKIQLNSYGYKHKAILQGVGINTAQLSFEEIEKIFYKKFKQNNNDVLEYQGKNGVIKCYKIKSQGLWGDIIGWLILEPDGNTIKNLVITHQEETPGLGAEIAKKNFLKKFKGKKLKYPDGSKLTLVKFGTSKHDNEIDGISGATLTTQGLSKGLTNLINKITGGKRE